MAFFFSSYFKMTCSTWRMQPTEGCQVTMKDYSFSYISHTLPYENTKNGTISNLLHYYIKSTCKSTVNLQLQDALFVGGPSEQPNLPHGEVQPYIQQKLYIPTKGTFKADVLIIILMMGIIIGISATITFTFSIIISGIQIVALFCMAFELFIASIQESPAVSLSSKGFSMSSLFKVHAPYLNSIPNKSCLTRTALNKKECRVIVQLVEKKCQRDRSRIE